MIYRLKNALWGLAGFLLLAPFLAFSQGSGDPTIVTIPNPLSATSIEQILSQIIDWLLVIAAPVAIIMAVWAGYLFISAGGNEEKVKLARKTLLYVVIGIAVLILSKGVLTLVISLINS